VGARADYNQNFRVIIIGRMKYRFLKLASSFIANATLCLSLSAAPQNSPPVIEHQIEPVWGPELDKDYLVDDAKVEMVIDPHGVPYSLSANSGLPDNVVEALARWRFRPGKKDGKDAAFAIVLKVPVRRELTAATQRATRRRWSPPSVELNDAIKRGRALDARDLPDIERALQADPQNASARATLLAYTATLPATAETQEARKIRADQIVWLTQNQPASPILGSPLAILNCAGDMADTADCSHLRDLWSNQLGPNALDPAILENASNFLRIADPQKAEGALAAAIGKVDNAGIWLGDLYGLAALGVTAINPLTGRASAAGNKLPDNPFANKVRSALIHATDVHIVFSGLNAITTSGRALAEAGHLPDDFPALCNEVLAHAKELYSGTVASCATSVGDRTAGDVPDTPIERVRVGGNIQAAALIKKVIPAYPATLKSRGIQGTVEFNAVIDKQGKVSSMLLLRAPLALYKPARDALSQWEYRPTLLNGHPVEVVTRLEVNFALTRR
jgi:hypothetical protein